MTFAGHILKKSPCILKPHICMHRWLCELEGVPQARMGDPDGGDPKAAFWAETLCQIHSGIEGMQDQGGRKGQIRGVLRREPQAHRHLVQGRPGIAKFLHGANQGQGHQIHFDADRLQTGGSRILPVPSGQWIGVGYDQSRTDCQ